MVSWVETVAADNMRSVLILLGSLFCATQSNYAWDDDSVEPMAHIALMQGLFDPPDQSLTPPAEGHCFILFDLGVDAESALVCRVSLGPAHRWDDEVGPQADPDRATRTRLYRAAVPTLEAHKLDEVVWAEFSVSAETATIAAQDFQEALGRLVGTPDEVRQRVVSMLCDRTDPDAGHVPGVSDDETESGCEMDEDGVSYGPVGRVHEEIVTRVPGGGVDAPAPRHGATRTRRDAFVEEGMAMFDATFRGARAADDPGLRDRTMTALANVYAQSRPPKS
jgi:hypothetical protein